MLRNAWMRREGVPLTWNWTLLKMKMLSCMSVGVAMLRMNSVKWMPFEALWMML